jgi:hypothetical protein
MSRFANLSERLSADLPKDRTRPDEDEEDETTTSDIKDKEKKDMNEEIEKAKAEGHAAGFKEANDRMNAVFASEHYKGREASAAKLLGKNMTADDIIDVLADMPKVEQAALTDEQQREAAEEAGRKEMKDALELSKNSNVDASGAAAVSADDANPMLRGVAQVNKINGLK